MKQDAGHAATDAALQELENRIAEIYAEAARETQKTIDEYFQSFEKRDAEMKSLIGSVQNGKEWTEEDYQRWRLNQIGRGERYQALREKLSSRMTDANATAVAYTNDATPGIYSLNRNFSAYTIEQVAGNVGFDMYDEQTVKKLILERPDLMPNYPADKALNRGIDLAWGKKQITASVTSSILQGKSIKGMADDLQNRIVTMNRGSAIRTARTAVTGAQNAGRMDSYAAAEKMGIKLKKQWVATLDGRTRHSHAMLDGEQIDQDKKFSNGCRFPGDPQGPPGEVYNCRCTLIAAVEGYGKDAMRRDRDGVFQDMTYKEWVAQKSAAAGQNVSASFAGTSGISDAFKSGMADTLKKCRHSSVKEVYKRHQNQLKCIDNHYTGGAYFMSTDGGIYFDEVSAFAGTRWQMPYQVAFHEFGHNIDWLMGEKNNLAYASNKEYNGKKLGDVIKKDYLTFKKASGKRKNDDLLEMLRSENMPLTECGNISDILEFCTNKSYPLGVGHGAKYHKRPGATEKEFFAEVLDSAAANEASFLQMERIFPNAVKMVFDIIGGNI